jgi:hypothetical protein
MYYNPQTEKLAYGHSDVRAQLPNVSMPNILTDAVLASHGYFPVTPRGPVFDPIAQNYSEAAPVLEDGSWVQSWAISPASDEEISQRTGELASNLREQRNALLSASDWTQVADAPVDQAAWATYRQALRDITAQEGFPHSVNWPVNP